MSAEGRGWEETRSRASLVENLRIRVETSRRKFQHGGGNPLIVNGGQVSCAALQHGGFGAQKVGHVVHPRFVAILRDAQAFLDRKSTRLNSSHLGISYAVFCLKKN